MFWGLMISHDPCSLLPLNGSKSCYWGFHKGDWKSFPETILWNTWINLSCKWSWNWKLNDILMFQVLMIASGPLCATISPVHGPQSCPSWASGHQLGNQSIWKLCVPSENFHFAGGIGDWHLILPNYARVPGYLESITACYSGQPEKMYVSEGDIGSQTHHYYLHETKTSISCPMSTIIQESSTGVPPVRIALRRIQTPHSPPVHLLLIYAPLSPRDLHELF